MPSQDSSSRESVSFGQACADLARQHPLKVMAIVGSAFFCAGLAASLSLGVVSVPQTTTASVTIPAASPIAAPSPSPTPSPPRESNLATDSVGTANCEKQTWPYLDQPCRDALAAKSKANPQVRVISTDRDAPSTLEAGVPAQPKAAAPPPRQEQADAALTPIIPVAPAAPVEPVPEAPAQAAAKPEAVASAAAAKEEPRGTDAKASTEAKPKPAGSAAVTATASNTPSLDPAAAAAPKAEKKKKARTQRAKPEKENADTAMVRETYSYADGREVSVVRRAKKDDRRRVAESEDDDEEEESEAVPQSGPPFLGWRWRASTIDRAERETE